jgi:hypothetical protein
MARARWPSLASIVLVSLLNAATTSRASAAEPLTADQWRHLPEEDVGGRIANDLLSILRNRWVYYGGEWNDFYGTKLATKPRNLGNGLCGADVLVVEYARRGSDNDRRLYPTSLRVEHRFRFLNSPNYNTPDSPFYNEDEKPPKAKTSCDQLQAGPPWYDWLIADSERQIRELALLLPALAADLKTGRMKPSNCADKGETDLRCRDKTGPFYVEDLSYVRNCSSESSETCYVIDSQAGGYSMVLKAEAFDLGGQIGRIKSVSIGVEASSAWGEKLYR